MIRNIVFDMGQVLIHLEPDVVTHRLGLAKKDEKLLVAQVFQSAEWANMDWGMITMEDAITSICRRVPPRLHDAVRRLVMEWQKPIVPYEGMEELAGELKGNGYRIYLLSNANPNHPGYWHEIPASRFFDGILTSYTVKTVKPQPEIYRMLCEKFDLRANECFFFDDQPMNVAGAINCGMSGCVFHGDMEELRYLLAEAGVKVRAPKEFPSF